MRSMVRTTCRRRVCIHAHRKWACDAMDVDVVVRMNAHPTGAAMRARRCGRAGCAPPLGVGAGPDLSFWLLAGRLCRRWWWRWRRFRPINRLISGPFPPTFRYRIRFSCHLGSPKNMPTQPQKEIIRLAFELSQAKLAAQASAALGADARAMSFCGACLAAAALLAGLANGSGFPVAMYVSASLMIVSATISGYAARPVPFYFPGNNFKYLEEEMTGPDSLESLLSTLGTFADLHIAKNSEILAENSMIFLQAVRLAISALVVAIVPPFLALS